MRRSLKKNSFSIGTAGLWRTALAEWLRFCATNRKVAVSIPAGVGGFFNDIKSFRSRYGPGVDSASNRNEYQGYFLGVKAAVRLTTLPTSCAVVTKSGNLNFLEPSGPLQACNGNALPFYSGSTAATRFIIKSSIVWTLRPAALLPGKNKIIEKRPWWAQGQSGRI